MKHRPCSNKSMATESSTLASGSLDGHSKVCHNYLFMSFEFQVEFYLLNIDRSIYINF